MKTKKISLTTKTTFVILLFLFSGIFQHLGVMIFNYDIDNLTNYNKLVLTSFSEIITFLILIVVYFKDLKEDFKKIKKDFNKNMDITIKYWFLGLIIMVVSNLIINFFIRNATAVNEVNVQTLIKESSVLALIVFGVIGPIVEELVFRKSFRDVLSDKNFILISGLIFGSLHVILSLNSTWDLFYLIPYCSLGIAFSTIYYKTDNIFFSIFTHIFHNTFFTFISVYGLGVILW